MSEEVVMAPTEEKVGEEAVKEPTEEKLSEETVNDPAEEKVGYGVTPIQTRWKKGESGNPRGRPKRKEPPTERAKQIILDEAYRMITVREGDKIIKMPAVQAIARSQIKLGLKGNRPAQRDFLEAVTAIEEEKEAFVLDAIKTIVEYQHKARQIQYDRAQRGLTDRPPGMPHPDDISFNMDTGTAILHIEGVCNPTPVLIGFKPPK